MRRIKITTQHPASKYGVPVCLIDERPVDNVEGLRACLERLDVTQPEAAELLGKSLSAISSYLYHQRRVPAEVWNCLEGLLAEQEKTERKAVDRVV